MISTRLVLTSILTTSYRGYTNTVEKQMPRPIPYMRQAAPRTCTERKTEKEKKHQAKSLGLSSSPPQVAINGGDQT